MPKDDVSIDRLGDLVLEAKRSIRERLDGRSRAAAERGHAPCATYLQLVTLRFVAEAGDPSMKDVAARLRVAPPSATAAIDSLVRAGLLSRRADAADRRTVRLRLTPKGRVALRRGMRRVRTRMRMVLSVLTREERRQLAGILVRLSSAMAPEGAR